MPPITDLVVACLREEIEFDQAIALVVLAGEDGSFDIAELEEITRKIDVAGDDLSPAQSLAAFFSWLLVEHVDDVKLKVGIALNFAEHLFQSSMNQQALEVCEIAGVWCEELAGTRALAVVLSFQANVYAVAGDKDKELALRLRCAAIAREIGDVQMEAVEEVCVGSLLGDTDPQAAVEHLTRSLERARVAGLHDCEALALVFLALLAEPAERSTQVDRLRQAASAALAARTRSRELVDAVRRIVNLQFELDADERLGDLLELGLALAREGGNDVLEGYYLGNLGSYLALRGDYEHAWDTLLEARGVAHAAGDDEGVAIADANLDRIRPYTRERSGEAPADDELLQEADKPPAVTLAQHLEDLAAEVAAGTTPVEAAASRLPVPRPDAAVMTEVALRVIDRAHDPDLSGRQTYALLALAARYVPDSIAPETAIQLLSMRGAYCHAAGAVDDALAAYTRALQAARGLPDARSSGLTMALTNLATVLRQQGRTTEAIVHYEEALSVARGASSEDALAMVLVNAATALDDLGRYEESRALNEEALPILTAGLPETGASLSICLLNYGGELLHLGDLDAAEQHLTRALEATRRHGGRRQEGPVFGMLGQLREHQGRYAESIAYFERALDLAEETGDVWNASNWCRDLGEMCLHFGLTKEAKGVFERGLDHARRVGDVHAQAICHRGMARAGASGDPEAAIVTLRSLWDAHGQGPDWSFAIYLALALAEAYLVIALGGQHLQAAILQGEVPPLPGRLAVVDCAALDAAEGWLGTAEGLARDAGRTPAVFGEALVLLRARILQLKGDPSAALEVLTPLAGGNPSVNEFLGRIYLHDFQDFAMAQRHLDAAIASREQLLDQFGTARFRVTLRQHDRRLYLDAMQCALGSGDLDGAFAWAERAKNAEGLRSLRFRHGAELKAPTLEAMRQVVGRLGDAAVVEFVPGLASTRVFIVASELTDGVVSFEVPGFGLPHLMALFAGVAAAYDRMKSPLAAFDGAALQQWRAAVEDACARLGRVLLGPVHERLRGLALEAVVFVPHSGLHCLPLHACPLPDGGLWGDTYTVSYAPSATLLAHTLTTDSTGRGGFVGFADPGGDLPCGRVEVAIAQESLGQGRVFEGAEASERRLLENLRSAGWIHLACHATQILGHGGESHLHMSPGSQGDDGRVSLATIQRDVVLTPGSTVLLSACETGAVTPDLADELVSLAGGFLFAGATSVISTYWRVRDAAALLFNDLFYGAHRAGNASLARCLTSAAAALRTMSNAEAFDRLTELFDTHHKISDNRRERILAPFREPVHDHRPFASPVDWAAFFLTGHP
ncbi:CHAT domain-containing protein [Streptomyces olivoreticuli]